MTNRIRQQRVAMVAATFGVALGFAATAASASPAPAEPTPVATALTNPRGFTWDESGNLVVALAGSGGDAAPTEDTPTNAVIGPFGGGSTAAVASIDASGCPAALATGLASALSATGEVLGAEDVAYLDGELYVGVDGGGAGHGLPDQPSGVYRVSDGSVELVADLSAWVRDNPVAAIPGDSDPDAAGYSLVVEPTSNTLWVDDPNSGQILSVAADGTVTRVVDLSDPHIVPTRLALAPDGGVYVGTLTTVPFPDGTAQVLHVGTDGAAEVVWTGLTTVVDVAVGPDGTLYALELSTGNTTEPPFLTPMSGRIVRQTGPDSAEPVVEGLMFPIAMEVGPDGAFYVSTPGIGANDGSGSIVRIDDQTSDAAGPAGTAAITSAPTDTAAGTAGSEPTACAPIEGTTGTLPPPPGTAPESVPGTAPASSPETVPGTSPETAPATAPATAPGTAPATAPGSAPATAPGSAPATESTVTIEGFAFSPAELSVAAGTTVTFVNNDTTAHTATADDDSWDTGTIDPGESATVTFEEPGTFAYHCNFHSSMTATITVT